MNDASRRWIIIGGGVGPMAGLALHRAVVEETVTDGTDQGHIPLVHLSAPHRVADRTEYLLGRDLRNPGPAMAELVAAAVDGIPREERSMPPLVAVPCNTFHADRILEPFLTHLATREIAVEFVHMIDETVGLLSRSRCTSAGVMSTTGTRATRIYEDALNKAGIEIIQVPPEAQDALHQTIYHSGWGLKAVSPPSSRAVGQIEAFATALVARGTSVLVPACTELPLVLSEESFAGVPVIDPVRVVARVLVERACGGGRSGGRSGDQRG